MTFIGDGSPSGPSPEIGSSQLNGYTPPCICRTLHRGTDEYLQPARRIRRETFCCAATDEVLVGAVRSGDRPAFAELWERHSITAFKVAYRITKNRDDAEDVIQDAWMKAYVHLNTFDGRAKFSTWLTRIVINSALMTLRRKRAHPETSMEFTDGKTWQHWEIADQTKDVEELYARHERIERLRRAIRRLPPLLRNTVEIQQSTDCSLQEIAKPRRHLGCCS
jgi:RNA polymerase sigma-70 factor, ECF subfamily